MSTLQRYNGLDTIATFQVWQALRPKLTGAAAQTYALSMALHGPALFAMLRGILVDVETVTDLRETFQTETALLEAKLDHITRGLRLGVVNLGSTAQVIWLLESLGAEIPLVRRKDGSRTPGVGREELEQLAKADPELAPICNIILAWRDKIKMLQVLQPELYDADNRMRTTYKICGTETDRFSSSKNALWTGMNMQNIKRDEKVDRASIRAIFIADPGCKFANIDLERADSWAVGLEVFRSTGDTSYLDACESFDLHTTVSRLTWPDLGWRGPNDPEHDLALAKQFFYRQYDYRFMAKKMGHGTNYLGKARTLAVQMKIPTKLAQDAQDAYLEAFPGIRKWHAIRARELQTTGALSNLFGRLRRFHSRLTDDSTLREAIAFLGQSVTAGVINRAILNLWHLQTRYPDLKIEFLAQVHDSVLIQYPQHLEDEILPLLRAAMEVPITVTSPAGVTITKSIPIELAVGWNWSGLSKPNPDGLTKLKEGQSDERIRRREPPNTKPRLMDRRISSLHRGGVKPKTVPEVGGDYDDWGLS